MSRRWSPEEIEFLKSRLNTKSLRSVAAQMDRTWHSVRNKASELGFRPCIQRLKSHHLDEIRRLHSQGMCDTEIAEALGFDRSTIGYRRRKMGLESNANSDYTVGRICRGVQRQCERLGISSPGALRSLSWAKRAREHGWPAAINGRCITRRQIDILDALYDYGPHTKIQLAKRLGMKIHDQPTRTLSSRGCGRSYLRELVEAGLVINLGRVVKSEVPGVGRSRSLYAIALSVERNFDA